MLRLLCETMQLSACPISQVFIFENLCLYHLEDPYQDESSTAWDNTQLHMKRPGSVPE